VTSQPPAPPFPDVDEFALRLPKVELHCQLIGAIPVEAYLDLAARNDAPIRSADPSDAYRFTSFEDFLDLYRHICLALQARDDFSQAAYEALGRGSGARPRPGRHHPLRAGSRRRLLETTASAETCVGR
jgi:hypothetical protein